MIILSLKSIFILREEIFHNVYIIIFPASINESLY